MAQEHTKLVVVIGATGNQGGSVARRFLRDPRFRMRGVTRNTASAPALKLAAEGAEMVQADLSDAASLKRALDGASVVFSVTNYWEPFFREDCRENARTLLSSIREYAYHVELAAGKNIADAVAATVDSLDDNGFLVSTLSHAGKSSGGKFADVYHHDAKADVFPTYVREMHPKLAAKMSCIQTGYFMTSHNILPDSYFAKLEDGSFQMQFCTDPAKVQPHLDVNTDLGNFVYAVHQMPPGKEYMAAGTFCAWPQWIQTWSKVTGAKADYKQVSQEEMANASADRDLGAEVAAMFAYSSDPGYDGGDMQLLKAEDIKRAGIDCPMTSLETYMARQDWSGVLQKEVTHSSGGSTVHEQ